MYIRRVCVGLVIALLLALTGCTGSGPVPQQAGQTAPGGNPQPAADALPHPPESGFAADLRSTSTRDVEMPGDFFADGTFDDLTQNAEPIGLDSIRLIPNGDEIAYAIYGVRLKYDSTRHVPYLAPLEMTVNTGGSNAYWVGLFDFGSEHWRFVPGPLSGVQNTFKVGVSSNAGDVEGTFWFAVVADRSAATDPSVTLNTFNLIFPDPPLIGRDYVEYEEYITASDGTELATTLFMPLQNTFFPPQPPPPFPVVLFRTPYDKDEIHSSRLEFGGDDRTLPGWLSELNVVLVTQYFRGRLGNSAVWPDSSGEETLFREHAGPDHLDAVETVDWLEDRAFYNGKLLLAGPSALGVQAFQAATQLGTRAAGIYAINSSADIGDWAARSNGCFKRGNVENWLDEHEFPDDLFSEALDQFGNEAYWDAVDFDTKAAGVRCPGYHETGWWDTDVSATIDSWSAFNTQGGAGAAGAQRLIIGPWSHDTLRMENVGELTFPTTPEANNATALPVEFAGFEGMLWALNLLERNSAFVPPPNPVLVYFMGEEGNTAAPHNTWISLPAWPPANSPQKFFLTQAGLLSSIGEPAELMATYQSDPLAPIATIGGELLPVGLTTPGPADQKPLHSNAAIKLYRSAPLGEDLVIAGEIHLDLYVSTSAVDTDFMVKLIDQYPGVEGRHMLVCDNAVRLSHLVPEVTPGEVYHLSFKLGDRAYVFGAGHKIGIDVQSTNFPRFDINPGNGDPFIDEEETNAVLQDNTLHFGPDNPTALSLPIFSP